MGQKQDQPAKQQQEHAHAEEEAEQQALDKPGQHIAADAAALCESLPVVALAAVAPFKLLYYRWAAERNCAGALHCWHALCVLWRMQRATGPAGPRIDLACTL